jgi:hypothetical protein
MDDKKQSIERIWWQKFEKIVLECSVSESLILIDLFGMLLHLPEGVIRHHFIFEFVVESVVVVSSIKVVGVDIDEESKDLAEDISPENGLRDKDPDSVEALDGIFGGDVSVCDGGDDCDSVVHDVSVHVVP